jgi:hypothetical protein
MDVAWEDNGQSIRPLKGPGKARAFGVPNSTREKMPTQAAAPADAAGSAKPVQAN